MKRSWNLAPVLQIVQKIPENYCPCLYLSIDQVWWLNELWFKRYSKMHLVSCTNTHHDITDFVDLGMVKNIKTWISWEQNITFLRNKKNLNQYLRWHILRSYCFVAGVTFNIDSSIKKGGRKVGPIKTIFYGVFNLEKGFRKDQSAKPKVSENCSLF